MKKILGALLLSIGLSVAQAKTLVIEVGNDQFRDAMQLAKKIRDKNSNISVVVLDGGRVQILVKTVKK